MMTELERVQQRLGYHESVVITRDEFGTLEAKLHYASVAIEECEGVKKQLKLAVEIIDGIVKCIDDDGNVTPADKKHLANRVVVAVKFTNNLD